MSESELESELQNYEIFQSQKVKEIKEVAKVA